MIFLRRHYREQMIVFGLRVRYSSPMWQQHYQQALNQQFQNLKERNPRFSMRSFAKKLGLSIATLSEVMSGKATLSERRAIDVIEKIGLSPELENQLLMMLKQPPRHRAEELPTEVYSSVSSWQARALLFACQEHFGKSEDQLRNDLGFSSKEIEEIVSQLVSENLLTRDHQGLLFRPKKILKTTDGISNESVRQMHHENLKSAAAALDTLPVDERDFTFVHLSIHPKDLDKVREEIRHLHARILTFHQDSAESISFQVAVQAYPMSQRKTTHDQNH